MTYYHVIKKAGAWHLYVGNAAAALLVRDEQASIVKAARALARQSNAKVVLHKEASGAPADDGGQSSRYLS